MWPSTKSSGDRSSTFFSSDMCITKQGSDVVDSSADLRCKYFLSNARSWWKVDILLNALSALNAPVSVECVPSTGSHSPVVFVADKGRIEISPSSFYTPFAYRRALSRGLVYAFDNARAKIDYNNIDHVTCTSIRGVNISGECDLWTKWTEYIGEDPLGMNMYSMKQRCVRNKVEELITLESTKSGEEVRKSIDHVWERCFRDHWPFTAEPHMDTRFRDSPMVRST